MLKYATLLAVPIVFHIQKKILSGKQFDLGLKTLFGVLLIGGLYWDLSHKDQLLEIWELFRVKVHGANFLWLAAALLLMPINWLSEASKWHNLLKRYEKKLSFKRSVVAVMAGVSFSIFTPNRIGEYGGRILFISKKNQWKAVIINIVGNISQIIVLLGAGALGLYFMLNAHFETNVIINSALIVVWVVGVFLMLFGFFNIDIVIPLARRIPFLHHVKRFVKDIMVLRRFSQEELRRVLLISVFRYVVYSLQYVFLLRFFGVEIGLMEGMVGVSTIFLLQTSIPLPPVMGLLARGNIAIYIWSFYGGNELSVLAATFSLWIINLILPAFLGMVFIFRTNIAKSLGYDDEE